MCVVVVCVCVECVSLSEECCEWERTVERPRVIGRDREQWRAPPWAVNFEWSIGVLERLMRQMSHKVWETSDWRCNEKSNIVGQTISGLTSCKKMWKCRSENVGPKNVGMRTSLQKTLVWECRSENVGLKNVGMRTSVWKMSVWERRSKKRWSENVGLRTSVWERRFEKRRYENVGKKWLV